MKKILSTDKWFYNFVQLVWSMRNKISSKVDGRGDADSSDRHVMDEAHLKPLVLDNSSSTAGCSTYFATSY
ncbi:hypothetical protein T4B_2438 [Trichinella pseudospiralis]|uniref:Uncharacterized protein n=1 Tax=Trichinella pseudospiralis TaxID=6337 RepID=A0A0V1HM02_TRIPS|nr:hypothetical protein T4B_3689 [Trichinella pseudospiralis]KRZ12401.1 hypothetical protein T4B_2438 [Trichinella pseudospiralis]